MYMLLSVVALCVTAYLIARQGFSLPNIEVNIQLAAPGALAAADEPLLETPPDDVMRYISAESEPWAQERLLQKAHGFHAITRDWSSALAMLVNDIEQPVPASE
jgi:hypothetical protein